MSIDLKFNPKKLAKLNNPERLNLQPPKKMWDALQLKNPECLVDLGAGTGFFALEFLKFCPDAKIYALDIAEPMLAWMNENLEEVKTGQIIPMKMEEAKTPLDDDLADLVFLFSLHHELHEPTALLQDCLRILKPGGKVLISDWKAVPTPFGPPQEIRVSEEKIIQDLEKSGFTKIKAEPLLEAYHFVTAYKAD